MIKNLLFDLGGVIIDIRRQDCVDAFAAMGLQNPEDYFGEYSQNGIFRAIEDGSATADDLHRELRPLLPENVTDYQIDQAFQRFITGIPVHRLQALRELRRKGYGIYVLSNTNPIMWNGIIASEFAKEGLRREDYFDGIVTSFKARSLKPDAGIFNYAVEHLGIRPEETLFFDDSQANVDAARALGFEALLVEPGKEFMDLLPE